MLLTARNDPQNEYDWITRQDRPEPGYFDWAMATLRQGLDYTMEAAIGREARRQDLRQNALIMRGIEPTDPQAQNLISLDPPMPRDEWEESEWFREGVEWHANMTSIRARMTADAVDRRRERQEIIARAQEGRPFLAAAGWGLVFLAQFADPINFIPFLGPAVRGRILSRFGWELAEAGRWAPPTMATYYKGRAALGAAEALIGTAATEPFIVQTLAAEGENLGYDDALLDILFGAAVGALLGVGQAWRHRGRVQRARKTLAVDDRKNLATAMELARGDLEAGRPVDVAGFVEGSGVRQRLAQLDPEHPTFNREAFAHSLRRRAGRIAPEEVDAALAVMDARAEAWAGEWGTHPDRFYEAQTTALEMTPVTKVTAAKVRKRFGTTVKESFGLSVDQLTEPQAEYLLRYPNRQALARGVEEGEIPLGRQDPRAGDPLAELPAEQVRAIKKVAGDEFEAPAERLSAQEIKAEAQNLLNAVAQPNPAMLLERLWPAFVRRLPAERARAVGKAVENPAGAARVFRQYLEGQAEIGAAVLKEMKEYRRWLGRVYAGLIRNPEITRRIPQPVQQFFEHDFTVPEAVFPGPVARPPEEAARVVSGRTERVPEPPDGLEEAGRNAAREEGLDEALKAQGLDESYRFDEQAEIDQLRSEGRLLKEEENLLDAVDGLVENAENYSKGWKAAVDCVVPA